MYKIINGECAGRIGTIETTTHSDTAIFYPIEGKHPKRIVVFKSDIIEIPDEQEENN